jgi:hypothetical protein
VTSLSIAVMAHPAREHFVSDLVTRLDDGVRVTWDDEGEPSSDPQRRWRTGARAWQNHDARADWHLVIQDDAIVSDDFIPGLVTALDRVKDDVPIVSPYFGHRRRMQAAHQVVTREAMARNVSWIRGWTAIWGVALVARTETIPAMLDWCGTQGDMPYDTRIGHYYRHQTNAECWYTWPSLVDHRQAPSLISHTDEGRFAHTFHAGSALDLDWGRGEMLDYRLRRAYQNDLRIASKPTAR